MSDSHEVIKSLEDDGVSEELFNLIWSKDELNFGPSINIPDTIVFKYGQPTVWYFTATNGRVKKKNRQNLLNARIEEVFNKYVLGYDVLATFVSMPVEKDPATGKLPQSTIEYLDRHMLNDFLYKRKKVSNGILQRFIEPKGTKNESIRAVWSPKVCLLERAENIYDLHDHRYGLYERCVTYEGPEYYYTSAPLRGPVLAGQIQKICESVVSHISEVTFAQKQVSRIVMNLKVDSRDKIWLLYSTSIRCSDGNASTIPGAAVHPKSLVNIDSVIAIPSTVNLNPVRSYDKIIPKIRVQCLSCAHECLEDLRHPVTYKSIVKHYEHVLHLVKEISGESTVLNWPPENEVIEAAGGVGFGCLQINMEGDPKLSGLAKPLNIAELQIPPMLHHIHPKLNSKSYFRCKKDPLFLYKTVLVCEACYLVYAEFTTMMLRMGQDLNKLLAPDPAAVTMMSHGKSGTQSSANRPSSADWRAMSTVHRSGSASGHVGELHPSHNHRVAKDNAIGLRSSNVRSLPEIPSMIRTSVEMEPFRAQASTISTGGAAGVHNMSMMDAGNTGSSMYSAGAFDADDIQGMIADRERHFFKEIAKNPQLRDQHPLMHLIAAQQKLLIADEQSGVVASKAAAKSESVFGTRYGKQTGDQYDRYSCYQQEQPYILKGEPVFPSKLKKQKEMEAAQRAEEKRQRKLRKKLRRQQSMSDAIIPGLGVDDAGSIASTASSSMTSMQEASSRQHNQFLRQALKRVEGEIDKSAGAVTKDSITAAPRQSKTSAGSAGAASTGGIIRRSGSQSAVMSIDENSELTGMYDSVGKEFSNTQDLDSSGRLDSAASNRPSTTSVGQRAQSSSASFRPGSKSLPPLSAGMGMGMGSAEEGLGAGEVDKGQGSL